MKNKNFILIVFLITCLGLTGCDQLNELYFPKKRKRAAALAAAPRKIQIIDDMELAQALLKPERKELVINRDPFKPLIDKNKDDHASKDFDELQKLVNKIHYQGLVNVAGSFSALIKTEKKNGAYRINDKLDPFTISEINADHIILKKDEYTFQLKRGEKK